MKPITYLVTLGVTAAILGSGPVAAAEARLKAGFFAPASSKSPVRQAFDMFVEKVNADGKGLVQISQQVGPDAIPGFELGNAVKNRLIDIAGIPPSYAGNLVPGIEALSTVTVPPARQRVNGAYALIDGILNRSMNAHLIGQIGYGAGFNLFLNRKISTVEDIKGMRLRTSDTYKAALDAFGAQSIRTKRGEIYTAMERGVIDGYPQLPGNVKSNGWHEVTKYKIEPAFYNVSIIFVMNLATWNGLDAEQQAFVNRIGQHLDSVIGDWFVSSAKKKEAELESLGVETVKLPDAEARKFLRLAYEAKWKSVEKKAPDYASDLKALLYE